MPNDPAFVAPARRRFLQTVLTTAAAGAATQAGFSAIASHPLAAATHSGDPADVSPEAALEDLITGNQRFASNQLTSIERDLALLRDRTYEKQKPLTAVLSCVDSRVPVELVFDQTIGELFAARVAGNLVTPEIMASLEYGVAALGVKALLVLGHSNCGAVKAAMNTEAVPGQISALYPLLRQAVVESNGNFDKAIAANVRIQADLLRNSSTVMRDAIKAGNLKIAGGVYDLSSGKVTLV